MKTPDIIIETSRKLRKNMTWAEKILWEEIRRKKVLGRIFYKQKPIYLYTEDYWLDRYIIPDFVNLDSKIIIEIDWDVHKLKEIYSLDKYKEENLKKLWFKILRFTNNEIFNDILTVLNKIKSSF